MKEEMINILYGKETWDIYKEFVKIENSVNKDFYKYYDEIIKMLLDDKSHIKLRGFILICKLSKYDTDNKINKDINSILNVLDDEKPTIVRQCLANINEIIINKSELKYIIKNKLANIDYSKYKDTMSPLIKKDINNLLKTI